jgi:hypothetical protein
VGWWVLLLAGWTQAASAQTYYLESEFTTTKDPATEVARIASEAGIPGRVVRLYVQNQGWRYLFRSEERPDDAELLSELGELRVKSAVGLRLVRVQDGRTEIMGDEAAVPAPVVPIDRTLDAQEVLRRVVRAHAGPAPAERIDAGGTLLFRFERTLDDRKVAHTYVRRGTDSYLQIDVLSGKGTNSRLGIVSGKAWLDQGEAGEIDALRVREQVERFSPTRVLSLPLEFAAGLPAGRPFELMTVAQSELKAGRDFVVLEWSGDRQSEPLRLIIDPVSWRIAEARWGSVDTAIRWSFNRYEELGDGVIFPAEVEVWKGTQRIDRIDVKELDLDPTLLPEWFPGR